MARYGGGPATDLRCANEFSTLGLMQPENEPTLHFDWRKPMSSLPHIIGCLVRQANPSKIVLFGSHARGDAREGSDIDLLVVLDRADDLRRAAIELQNALTGITIPVDIVVATPALLAKYATFPGYVFRAALAEGVVVYERR